MSASFLPDRQCNFDTELLAQYRQALEAAMSLSVKHNLPPLPGRTHLVYLTDAGADNFCAKSNAQGVQRQNHPARGREDVGKPEKRPDLSPHCPQRHRLKRITWIYFQVSPLASWGELLDVVCILFLDYITNISPFST